jgi:hypothetical protein
VSTPADWGLRFQELAADAGQMYARTLRRHHELLDRVARHELTPEYVQQQFRDYIQEHAATSTRELVELSVGLLAGLLHVEARYRDALLDGLIPPSDPPPPPPSPSTVDISNWFQALAAYASEQSRRSMTRHQQLVDRVAAGEVAPERVRAQGQHFLEHHAPALLGDVMGLGLTFAGRLQQSSTAVSEGLYDRLLGPTGSDATQPLEPPVCVDLRASSGAVASACIVVENSRLAAADVECRASDFVRRAGGDRFLAALEIVPDRFRLAPGDQRDVEMRLHLDPALFAVGSDYVATLLVAGAGERDLVIQLMARAESPAVEPQTDQRAPERVAEAAAASGRSSSSRARRTR